MRAEPTLSPAAALDPNAVEPPPVRCPFCGGARLGWVESRDSYRRRLCRSCRSMFLEQIPSGYRDFYTDPGYFNTPTNVFYGYHFYDEIKPQHYAQARRRWRYMLRRAQRKGCAGPFQRLIDIGCGPGYFMEEIARAGVEVHGIEPSGVHVRAAPSIRQGIFHGFLADYALEGAPFDVAVCQDVVEHWEDVEAGLDGVRALLRPGGLLFISTPRADSLSYRLFRRYWLQLKEDHPVLFSKRGLALTLERHGFEPIGFRTAPKFATPAFLIGRLSEYFRFLHRLQKLPGLAGRLLRTIPLRVPLTGEMEMLAVRR